MNFDMKNGGTPFDGFILVAAGTALIPAIQIGGAGSGFYSPGTNQLSVSLNGTSVLQFGTAGITVPNLTANDITGGDASLGITGQAAAQGGAVAIAGGASSTTSNSGGAITMTGGASGTGSSVNGGSVAIAGGASLSTTDGSGGAIFVTGGAGAGIGLGGALTFAGGASGTGATGNGGAANIAGGAALSTNGVGGAVTLISGAGVGTGASGNINIAAGASGGSATTDGEVQIEGSSSIVFASYFFTGTPAATTQVFFVAPRAMRVKTITEVHSVAAGGVSTMTITKDTSTNAPGAGTSLHQSGSFDLNGTANTPQTATVATTLATVNMAAGDRLAVKFANAIQSSAGITVTVGMVPI